MSREINKVFLQLGAIPSLTVEKCLLVICLLSGSTRGRLKNLIPEDVVSFEFEYLHDFEPAIETTLWEESGNQMGLFKEKNLEAKNLIQTLPN